MGCERTLWGEKTLQQLGHARSLEPEIEDGSTAKDGALERLRCGTIQKGVSLLDHNHTVNDHNNSFHPA